MAVRKMATKQIPPGLKLRNTLHKYKDLIFRIAWSPDGQMLASPLKDKIILVWDMNTGEVCLRLEGHTGEVNSVAWSPDGRMLASCSDDRTIRIWDTETGRLCLTFNGHCDWVCSVAWSPDPDGRMLASGSADKTIRLWDIKTKKLLRILEGHSDNVNSVAWSPDGQILASCSIDGTIRIWDTETGKLCLILNGHHSSVCSVAWSPDGKMLASGSVDKTIRIWDTETGQQTRVLEGHTNDVNCVCFSFDCYLFASKSCDSSVRIWRCDKWETVAVLDEPASNFWLSGLAFHPKASILATLGKEDTVIRIWDLDMDVFSNLTQAKQSILYTNAKVVLVGEHSTGKTCLARALMGEPFIPQESTHGMRVWHFHSAANEKSDEEHIIRETFLWDLAGQTDYQIVHQLFLDETALAIVLFDPTHPENPFGGVEYWEKALQRIAKKNCPKLLVAGRVDRGYPNVTEIDIKAFLREHGFSKYIATSAKTDQGVEELRITIACSIPWNILPVTSSPQLWKDIREYLLERRAGKDVLTRRADLREAFSQGHPETEFTEAEFDTVISHAQVQGLVWRLSFGDFVLLKPELLNNYASAVVRVARKHTDGLGCVAERDVLETKINFEDMERLADTVTERSLLHAVVELFLNREVALREGDHLVFPSKFNRKRPGYPKPTIHEVAYNFAGPVEDIYATLVVRLFYCGAFKLKDLWKNAAEFYDSMDRICGFQLINLEEGRGAISVFFEKNVSTDNKVLFLRFIHEHFHKRALADSVIRERIYRCPKCNEEIENKRAVELRLKKGKKKIVCQICDEQILLIDLLEDKFGDPELLQQVRELDEEVEEKKEHAIGVTTAKAKENIGEFDIFLAHNSVDKPQVEAIAEQLKLRGLSPWLDKEQIPPGCWFQDVIQQAIPKVKSAAVIIGLKGLGKWQSVELRAFISQCVERDIPIIPVLLPSVKEFPKELKFLKEFCYVRFSKRIDYDVKALDDLEWGITRIHPQRKLK